MLRSSLPEIYERFKQPNSDIHLDLSSLHLEEIPPQVYEFENLETLDLSENLFPAVPEKIFEITSLKHLNINNNIIRSIQPEIKNLSNLEEFNCSFNDISNLPNEIGQLDKLRKLNCSYNQISSIPSNIGFLKYLEELVISGNKLTDLPNTLSEAKNLIKIKLDENKLNKVLKAANSEGSKYVIDYIRQRAAEESKIREIKLITIGEGTVGKTCLLDSLEGKRFKPRKTTHGIEIRTFHIQDENDKLDLKIHGWDFGGQDIYRPTHQFFFTTPAIYLVVWHPRDGMRRGDVYGWIKLIKNRVKDPKFILVSTHARDSRTPDVNLAQLRERFGKNSIKGLVHVENKGSRININKLKKEILDLALKLPDTINEVPLSWKKIWENFDEIKKPVLSRKELFNICSDFGLFKNRFETFITMSNKLGYLTWYPQNEKLKNLVILKPDWLAQGISKILESEKIRDNNGLVRFSTLKEIVSSYQYNYEARNDGLSKDELNNTEIYIAFEEIMKKFDLSYEVNTLNSAKNSSERLDLITQHITNTKPIQKVKSKWAENSGKVRKQICEIGDEKKGNPANAEGIIYRLVARFHRYSFGKHNYEESIHWYNGMLLDNGYNGIALVEKVENNIEVTVKAAFPINLLAILTNDIKGIIDENWGGLQCKIMVPCNAPCEYEGSGLFPVEKMIQHTEESGNDIFRCPKCSRKKNVSSLLQNSTIIDKYSEIDYEDLREEVKSISNNVKSIKNNLGEVRDDQKKLFSQVEDQFRRFIKVFNDEAKDGPRLFSVVPVVKSNFNPSKLISREFKITLWCEHSKLPLPLLNPENEEKGVYKFKENKQWFEDIAPYLSITLKTLQISLPLAFDGVSFSVSNKIQEKWSEELEIGEQLADFFIEGNLEIMKWINSQSNASNMSKEKLSLIEARNGMLRRFQALIRKKDPGFGGLVRVLNSNNKFIWVHKRYEDQYN